MVLARPTRVESLILSIPRAKLLFRFDMQTEPQFSLTKVNRCPHRQSGEARNQREHKVSQQDGIDNINRNFFFFFSVLSPLVEFPSQSDALNVDGQCV